MLSSSFLAKAKQHATVGASLLALLANLGVPTPAAAQTRKTAASPIQHVIILFGENRSFDHVFATYKPKPGETVSNLLSKGIIDAQGNPGPNYALSAQYNAVDTNTFSLTPANKTAYLHNPPVVAGGPTVPYFPNLKAAITTEPNALPTAYYQFMTTGGTGLSAYSVPDTRIPNVLNLPNGVFQLTPSVGYDDYANSPVHRFFQMWQQNDCGVKNATPANPSGCLADLFPYVEVTIGAGSDGSSGFLTPPTSCLSPGEGSTAMEFYNVQQGDAPFLK
jgi:phospholipase C